MHRAKISMGIMSVTGATGKQSSQPWNLSAELEHKETLVVLQNSIQQGALEQSLTAHQQRLEVQFTPYSVSTSIQRTLLAWQGAWVLQKLNATLLHSKSLLGSKWLLSFVEESRSNWCPWQNAHQRQWSQDFACMCPQDEKKKEIKISAANSSVAKVILFRAFWLKANSSGVSTFCDEPSVSGGKKAAPYQMVIFDNSFLGEGKLGLIQEPCFTFPRHIREQFLLCSVTFFLREWVFS